MFSVNYGPNFKTFIESNSPDIPALWKTNLDDSIDSGSFFVRGYLSLIQKDSSAHMHSLTVYVKDFLQHGTYLQKALQILTFVFDWIYFTQCLTSFSSIDHPLCLYAQFVIRLISSNIDEVLSTNPSQTTLLRWLTNWFTTQTVILTTCSFGFIYFF